MYEENFEYEEALKHYIASQAFEHAARVLGYLVPSVGLQGRFHLANSYLEKIPDQYWQEQPWLVFIKGHIQALGGKNQIALKTFQKALLLFQKQDDQSGIRLCYNELARHHLVTGDFLKAEVILKQILTTHGLPAFASILNIGYLMIALAHLLKFDEADLYYHQGLSILSMLAGREQEISRAFLDSAHGFRYYFVGNYVKAAELAKKAIALLEQLDIDYLIGHSRILLSGSLFFLGRFKESLESAEYGLRIANERGYKDLYSGWLMVFASLNASKLGRMQEALAFVEEALSFFQRDDSPYGKASCYRAFFEYYMQMGDHEAAAKAINEGLEITEYYLFFTLKSLLPVSMFCLSPFNYRKL